MRREYPVVRAILAWFYNGYRRVNAGDLAAAVAFNALIALVPTFLLLISIAGFILRQDDDALRIALHAAVWALPPAEARTLLEALRGARGNFTWFGLVSLIGFAWVGMNFISCLARSMNRIYGVPNQPFVHQRIRSFTVILAFAALLILATIAGIVPTFFMSGDVAFYFRDWPLADASGQIVSYGISAMAATALFFILYRVVPNAGQRARDIWPGALTAATLFLISVQAFPVYLRLTRDTNGVGSALILATLLVTWFYLLAHVLLFGAYVNATYRQHCRRRSCDPADILKRLRGFRERHASHTTARR